MLLITEFKQFGARLVLEFYVTVLCDNLVELLKKALFKPFQTVLQIVLLARVLGYNLREGILDPGLVIVGDVTIIEQVERLDWLDKVHMILLLLFFCQLETRSMEVSYVIQVDFEMLVDAQEQLHTATIR